MQDRSDRGATVAEYCILIGFIALVIIGTVAALGIATDGLFETAMQGW